MKKLIVLAVVAFCSFESFAQTAPVAEQQTSVQLTKKELTPEQKEAMQKVKVAAKEARESKKAVKAAKASGDQAAVDAAKAVEKAEKTEVKAQVKAAKDAGVKAPMKRVAKQRKAKKE
jgi:hypothetical protein